MPEADIFEAPQGKTFHAEPLLQSVTEAFVGNGVLANGDATVTADGAVSMGIDIAAADTGISYDNSTYTPTAASFTLSDGPTTTTTVDGTDVDDTRVDLVYFDSTSGSYAVTEGTPDAFPVPPSVPADALMLAVVLVPHEATDIADPNILNWRARPTAVEPSPGGEVEFDDGIRVGFDDGTITETSSPTSFTFTAGFGHDVADQVDVTLSNSSGASATEDVTVELYDGTGTGGTLVNSETKSVSLNDGASTTETFISTDDPLDDGDYHINITTSGSDLSIDQTDVVAPGAVWSLSEDADGDILLTNQYTGTVALLTDPITNDVEVVNGNLRVTTGGIFADDGNVQAGSTGNTNKHRVSASREATGGDTFRGDVSITTEGYVELLRRNVSTSTDLSSLLVTGTAYQFDLDLALDTGETVVDYANKHVPRPQVDDAVETTGPKTAAYTTTDDEVVFVDTSGGAVTITLASADVTDGNKVQVIDVGGSAGNNAITIDTEGSETIDGATSKLIEDAYGGLAVVGDGTNWFTAGGGTGGGGGDPVEVFEGRESGSVSDTNQGVLIIDNLADGETVEVYKTALVNADGSPVATGVDLELVTMDNAGSFTSRSTLIQGDGATVFDDETGSPLGTYTNSSGSGQTIAVLVDNGSGASVSIMASVEGVTGA